ncbi:helix-turn-helix transcriptional regulator [Caproiciproducens sp. R1]|uniref:helix-turn-helix transcriptional regulator n=1 Tax=Caproiciproducens sp. R1 TaxID=3435000 RepID=UPI0040339AE0
MNLGENLFKARKQSGLSQEEVAEKLGVRRQTISKWELDETLPDIRQSKELASLYHLSLDELIEFDVDLKEIERVIENTTQEKQDKINWTNVWGEKYPILTIYQNEVDTTEYAETITKLLKRLSNDYGYNDVDSLLVLKDILAQVWKQKK